MATSLREGLLCSTRAKQAGLGVPSALASGALKNCGGGDRIRTCDALTGIPVFKTGALSHSATPPCQLKFYLSVACDGVVQCWQEGQ